MKRPQKKTKRPIRKPKNKAAGDDHKKTNSKGGNEMGIEFKADAFNDIFDVAMRRVKNNG